MIEVHSGKRLVYQYNEKNREGDHICYITDMTKFRARYPDWSVVKSLDEIIKELILMNGKKTDLN